MSILRATTALLGLLALLLTGCQEPMHSGFKTEAIEDAIRQGLIRERELKVGAPILHELCDVGCEDRPDLILAAIHSGADVNKVHDRHTALLICVETAKLDSTRVLVEFGADTSAPTPTGKNAFAIASTFSEKRAQEFIAVLKTAKSQSR
ncbi:MAG: hypothetical protein IPK97_00520 [Ahniella sp.]|nr:hypothetical protein [Ahniella sp.]